MKKRKSNLFDNLLLDKQEKLLEESLERGEFEDSPNFENTKRMLQEAATRYSELHTSKPVTLRINQLDLIKIKAKAKRKQIPYQTLIGALLHEYAVGEKDLSL